MFIPLNSSSSLIPVDGSAAVVGCGVVGASVGPSVGASVGASVVSSSPVEAAGVVFNLTLLNSYVNVVPFPACK